MVFLDTNILLYAISSREEEAPKRAVAERTILAGGFGLSTQVMVEFYVNAIKPTPQGAGFTSQQAQRYLDTLLLFNHCQPTDTKLVMTAIWLHQRFRIDWWDAPILAAAQRLGCSHLLSEDFSHGQDYDGVTIINPFLETAA
jgi:predicted nucleic acid-binding protein